MKGTHRQASGGWSLPELLLVLAIGMTLVAVMLQALLGDGRASQRLARVLRERIQQRRTLELVRADLLRAEVVDLPAQAWSGVASSCGLAGRRPALRLRTAQGLITYTQGEAPSAIWRGKVLMRCGPAYGLDGEPSSGDVQNRVLIDALPLSGFQVESLGPLWLRVRLVQEFQEPGGGRLRVAMQQELASGG
jgi:type II secretory pathway pseudopilin PulG